MALSFPTYRLSTLFDAAGPFSNLAGGFSLRPLDEVFMTQALLLIPTEMAQRDAETGLRQGLCSLGCWEFSLQALGPIPFTRLEAYTADTRFLSLLLTLGWFKRKQSYGTGGSDVHVPAQILHRKSWSGG